MRKTTVEFNDAQTQVLEELAKAEGLTKTQVIRRALALLRFYEQEVRSQNRKLAVVDESDHVIKEIVTT